MLLLTKVYINISITFHNELDLENKLKVALDESPNYTVPYFLVCMAGTQAHNPQEIGLPAAQYLGS